MAVSRTLGRKAPTQSGKDFFECKQQGGAHGSPQSQPDKPASGALREKIYGKSQLNKSQT